MSDKEEVITADTLLVTSYEDWDDSVLSCSNDVDSCYLGLFCSPILLAKLYDKTLIKGIFPHICILYLVMYIYSTKDSVSDQHISLPVTQSIFFGYVYYLRKMFKRNNNMVENRCQDCIYSLCIPSCVLCQIARHHKNKMTNDDIPVANQLV